MIPLSAIRDFVKVEASKVPGNPYADVTWDLGVDVPAVPGRFALFSSAIGSGLATEWVTDVSGLDLTVAGQQGDYDSAESLAYFVDRTLLGSGGSRMMGAHRVIDLSRFGGVPYNSLQDDANRYHFVSSYLLEVESGLALDPVGG